VLLAETGEVTDAAAVVTLLASPRVGFVTGAVVTVDGGASPGLF
jgi:NAD(P)-dependent dehydrogenase (short-subunit alcohol dehydrogenase family)